MEGGKVVLFKSSKVLRRSSCESLSARGVKGRVKDVASQGTEWAQKKKVIIYNTFVKYTTITLGFYVHSCMT